MTYLNGKDWFFCQLLPWRIICLTFITISFYFILIFMYFVLVFSGYLLNETLVTYILLSRLSKQSETL